jgi:uncharacterized integral membrane protein
LNLKDTYELLEIWKTNDRVEWSDTAFDMLREILAKRIGELPPQDEPILSHDEAEGRFDLELDEWEVKLIDSESQPDFYDTFEVIELRRNINKVAKAVIIVNILSSLLVFPVVKQAIAGYFPTTSEIPSIVSSLLFTIFGVGLTILVTYFPLKALEHILRILMEMEFNSRITK